MVNPLLRNVSDHFTLRSKGLILEAKFGDAPLGFITSFPQWLRSTNYDSS